MQPSKILELKAAVAGLATTSNLEIYELILILEDTERYHKFSEQYGRLAWEIFTDKQYAGDDLRISLITVNTRSRTCDYEIDEIGFWEDLSMIVSLYESLEKDGCYACA